MGTGWPFGGKPGGTRERRAGQNVRAGGGRAFGRSAGVQDPADPESFGPTRTTLRLSSPGALTGCANLVFGPDNLYLDVGGSRGIIR